jgi:hypothetical protein
MQNDAQSLDNSVRVSTTASESAKSGCDDAEVEY